MHQADWRGVPAFDVSGRKMHFTIREMRHATFNVWMLVFFFLLTAIFVLSDIHGYREFLSIPKVALLWFVLIIIVTFFNVTIVGIGTEISKRFSRFFLILPLIGLFSMTAATFITNFNLSLMLGEPFTVSSGFENLTFNLVLGFLFESLFTIFVYPVIISNLNATNLSEPSENERRTVIVAGKTFAAKAITSVSAQDHYLEIKTKKSCELLRGRMSDVVGQLGEEDGITPHRSHWVARMIIDRIACKSNAKILVLTDGTEIPVARARVADVQAWLENRNN